MAILIDSSVLGRLANTKDATHAVAFNAVAELRRRGEVLHITPQVMIEFRNVGTRATSLNGLGLTIAETEAIAMDFEARFAMLADHPGIYTRWKSLVGAMGIIGKQVHDARLVAVCHVHAVSHILTFNVAHFNRMATFGPGVVVLDPATV